MWVGSGPAGEGGQEGAGREGVGMAAVGAGEFFVAEEILLAVGVAPWFAVGVVVGALGDGAAGIHHGDVVPDFDNGSPDLQIGRKEGSEQALFVAHEHQSGGGSAVGK